MDKIYTHLLAAIELNDSGEGVLKRARDLAGFFGARLSVVHAVEYIPLDAGETMIAAPMDLSLQLSEQAREQLRALCERAGVAADSAQVVPGGVVTEILRLSDDLKADLIVIGHQQRSGLAALFSHRPPRALRCAGAADQSVSAEATRGANPIRARRW
jgi:universal stress protein A